MEIYDTVNRLASEIKNSDQYKNLKMSKDKLMQDEEKKKMIIEFEQLKQEVQFMEIQKQKNEEIDEQSKKEKLAKMYNVLIENKDIKEYFDYEIAFNQLMVDINKIIGNTIKDVL